MATAQRIQRLHLNRSRMEKVAKYQLNAIGLQDTIMDTILLTHAPFNLSAQKMIITDWALRFASSGDSQAGFFIEETVMEEDDSVYAWTGATDETTPVVAGTQVRVDMEPVPAGNVAAGTFESGMTFDLGNGNNGAPLLGVQTGTIEDGDVVTFDPTFNNVPTVTLTTAGLTTESTLAGDVAKAFDTDDLTTTGFTASLLLKETAGAVTSHTDTGAVVGGTFDFEMEKQNTTPNNAWNNRYTFQFDVTVQNLPTTPVEPGSCVIDIYMKRTGASPFVLVGSKTVGGDTSGSTTTRLNQIKTVTVTGVVDFAGVQFAVDLGSSLFFGSSVDAFDSVKYDTVAAPNEASATPAGVTGITFEAVQ